LNSTTFAGHCLMPGREKKLRRSRVISPVLLPLQSLPGGGSRPTTPVRRHSSPTTKTNRASSYLTLLPGAACTGFTVTEVRSVFRQTGAGLPQGAHLIGEQAWGPGLVSGTCRRARAAVPFTASPRGSHPMENYCLVVTAMYGR